MAKTKQYRVKTGTFQDLVSINAGVELNFALETITTLQNTITWALGDVAMQLENDHTTEVRNLWALSYLSEICESIGQACIVMEAQ